MRPDLLAEINHLSATLAKVTTWKNSKDAFGHIVTYEKGVEKIAKNSYIYEFYCYMKLLEDLNRKSNQNTKFILGNGIFPRSPAPKTNRPYFILEVDKKEIFQICAGTQIQTKIPNLVKAPDISFQSMSADSNLPHYNDILAISDSKYSESKNSNSFQENQMVLFSDMIKLLKLKKVVGIAPYFTDYIDFKGNCLLTNKESFTTDLNLLKYYRMTVIENFDIGKTCSSVK